MVKYRDDRLDLIFSALSDRTRRGLLARLASGKTFSVSDLAQPLDMSLPAVMKDLAATPGDRLCHRIRYEQESD